MMQERAMVFVDGSNLLIEMFRELGLTLRADKPSANAINFADHVLTREAQAIVGQSHQVVRSYWFGSIQGNEEAREQAARDLRAFGFDAKLFRKAKGREEKGVDLAIAREMLIHAFNKNYDTAVLVAGDEDYLGLVEDLKRLGVSVRGMFFETKALSPKLKIAFDRFRAMDLAPTMIGQSALLQALRAERTPVLEE